MKFVVEFTIKKGDYLVTTSTDGKEDARNQSPTFLQAVNFVLDLLAGGRVDAKT